jgi:hypothetical protein
MCDSSESAQSESRPSFQGSRSRNLRRLPARSIHLNSGVYNPDLLVPHPSPTVSSIWQTECVLADREHSRIIEPESLQGLNGTAVAALTTHPS